MSPKKENIQKNPEELVKYFKDKFKTNIKSAEDSNKQTNDYP